MVRIPNNKALLYYWPFKTKLWGTAPEVWTELGGIQGKEDKKLRKHEQARWDSLGWCGRSMQ